MGILGVYMHFHSSTEVTCPWMSSSTQETARLWMPPPQEEEHAVHGVASHLQKQGESSGQTRTWPHLSDLPDQSQFPCLDGESCSQRPWFKEPKPMSFWNPRSKRRIPRWQKCFVNHEANQRRSEFSFYSYSQMSVLPLSCTKDGISVHSPSSYSVKV